MEESKHGKTLLDLLEKTSNIDSKIAYRETRDFLFEEGFSQNERGSYVLEDLQGRSHIGIFYEFGLHSNIDSYRFKRKLGHGETKVYEGAEAIRALVKTIQIKNAIYEAEKEGLIELSEHLTSDIDLDFSDD